MWAVQTPVQHAHHRWGIHANRNCRPFIHEKLQYKNESYRSLDNAFVILYVHLEGELNNKGRGYGSSQASILLLVLFYGEVYASVCLCPSTFDRCLEQVVRIIEFITMFSRWITQVIITQPVEPVFYRL